MNIKQILSKIFVTVSLLLAIVLLLSLASCTPEEQCGMVMAKKIIYGTEYQNKDMPIGYTITTDFGTYQVSKSEYDSVKMYDSYCK